MSNSLEFADWLDFAVTNNLLLTSDEYQQLIPGQEYEMVEIDYIGYFLPEYVETGEIEFDKPYAPKEIYERLKRPMISSGEIYEEESYIVDPLCEDSEAIIGIVQIHNFMTGSMYALEDGILVSNEGAEVSRWILWDNLEKMPNVYFAELLEEENSNDKLTDCIDSLGDSSESN
jgi:hypothetical protein